MFPNIEINCVFADGKYHKPFMATVYFIHFRTI